MREPPRRVMCLGVGADAVADDLARVREQDVRLRPLLRKQLVPPVFQVGMRGERNGRVHMVLLYPILVSTGVMSPSTVVTLLGA